MRKREHPFPGNIMQTAGTFDANYGAEEVRFFTDDLDAAAVLTSIVADEMPEVRPLTGYPMHRPVLDLDFPAQLIPSSTPGHFHLYLDVKIPWRKYMKMLKAMEKAGVLEPGYVRAAHDRGFSGVRLPWIKK